MIILVRFLSSGTRPLCLCEFTRGIFLASHTCVGVLFQHAVLCDIRVSQYTDVLAYGEWGSVVEQGTDVNVTIVFQVDAGWEPSSVKRVKTSSYSRSSSSSELLALYTRISSAPNVSSF
jgi:hypothetical protein